ncbi:MAG TPA: dipeptidase [Ornithinimicrobium sp.]|uniref:dipeptidase n=1 Tax=Ornithinimicrobium sp. TaxID=1977084 RepID=UPI002B4934B3|nr:dipeptidase [Ornithinimicrobium sp.]HKJ11422.1 dipeptidase [Ornithinimicrobium sp.]
MGEGIGDRVSRVLSTHPVADGHNDLLWQARQLAAYDWDTLDLARGCPQTQTDLPRLRAGRVGAQFWSVYVPATLPPERIVAATLEQIDAVHSMVRRYAADLQLAHTADEVERAMAAGRIASLLGAEGGHSIAESLPVLRTLHRLGVRYLTLTHNTSTPWADSATGERLHGGLTDFGRRAVREMNRLGMAVDLSHVSAETMRDALEVSHAPVIFSHSGARAVCESPRNVPDDVLSGLADRGGICMATFVPAFVSPTCWAWRQQAAQAARAEGIEATDLERFEPFTQGYAEQHPPPTASLNDVVQHIEHLREVAGIDHIGLGGDYDGVAVQPEGLEDVSGYPNLLQALARRGFSDEDLGKIASGNILRVMREIEAVAD